MADAQGVPGQGEYGSHTGDNACSLPASVPHAMPLQICGALPAATAASISSHCEPLWSLLANVAAHVENSLSHAPMVRVYHAVPMQKCGTVVSFRSSLF